jgi:hypothetical protein
VESLNRGAPMKPTDSINGLTLSPQTDARMRELEQRQHDGQLTADEANELDVLLRVQELLAELRAKAKARHGSAGPVIGLPARTMRNGLPIMQVPAGTPAIDPVAVRRFLEEQAF